MSQGSTAPSPGAAADAAALGQLIAESFHHLPVAQWIVPDPRPRTALLAAQFTMLVEHAMTHGAVHVGDDGAAVAVWFDNTKPFVEIDGYDERLAAAVGEHLPRFQAFDELMASHHPHEPHHHLALLAVRADAQGRGLGSRLLDLHHAWLDEQGIDAFLEASSAGSRELYLRHGYAPHGEPYHTPDGAPMFPMWRKAG